MKKTIICTTKLAILLFATIVANCAYSQNKLYRAFQNIEDTIHGKLGVSALLIETGEIISLNGRQRFPMQSVYKFPIAFVMLSEVDSGTFTLDDSIMIEKSEYIPKEGHSPLREKFPNGTTLTIREILGYNISKSDGTACDVLIRLLGGTEKIEEKIHSYGVKDIAISTTEMVQVANDTIQYQNWTTPLAMTQLLEIFHQKTFLSQESYKLLAGLMSVSNPWFDKRLKGLLPKSTPIAHKTGTSGTYNGLTRATNDSGIITLPDGRHLAISVFVSDSYDSQSKREKTIASASKAAYDYFLKN